MRTKTLDVALTAVVLAAGLSACTADDPEPESSQSTEAAQETEPSAEPGLSEMPKPVKGTFRSDPFVPGEAFEFGDWELTFGETDPDATQAVVDAEVEECDCDLSPSAVSPEEGNVYIAVAITATYTGNTSEDPAYAIEFDYVSADGNTYTGSDMDTLEAVGDLYTNATGEGSIYLEVDADDAEGGYWRIAESDWESTSSQVYVASTAAERDPDDELALDGTPCVYLDGVCFSRAELEAHAEEQSGVGDLTVEEYLAFAPEEQSAVNHDLDAAGKFAEWEIANPLTGPCAEHTAEGLPAQTLIEMGFGPEQCPNE